MAVLQENRNRVDVVSTADAAKIIGVKRARVHQLLWEYEQTKGKRGLPGTQLSPRSWVILRADCEKYRDVERASGRPRTDESQRERGKPGSLSQSNKSRLTLIKLRRKQGRTDGEIAAELGVTPSALSKWLSRHGF